MLNTNQILDILNNHYPITPTKVVFFRDGGSFSYVVHEGKKKYFLRVIRPPFRDTALQSIDINLYLLRRGFPVPPIQMASDGKAYRDVCEQGENYLFILYDYIEGRELNQCDNMECLGRLTGRLHALMKDYNAPLKKQDKYFFIDRYIHILRKKQYPETKVVGFQSYGDILWERVKNLNRGFCHGDYHRGNIHQTPSDKLYVLDFDTSCHAFPMYDVMMICNETNYFEFEKDGYANSKKSLESFLTGYSEYNTLSREELDSFPDLIAIYHYQLQATIIELYGLDCVDEPFLDNQFNWLMRWRECTSI